MRNVLFVALGGAFGSVFRYLVSQWIPLASAGDFPWATFGVNLLGSFLIGLIIGKLGPEDTTLRLLLITGFCGGFTTFSTFANETVQLLQGGYYFLAFLYVLASVVFGTALVGVGVRIFA